MKALFLADLYQIWINFKFYGGFLLVALVIAAACPRILYMLSAVLSIEMPVNLVFLLMFCYVLAVLLSLSIAICQLAEKCRRLTQANALLEKRLRELEEHSAER